MEVEISLGSIGGKTIEDLVIEIPMPKQVNSVSLTPTIGVHSFDQVAKCVRWEVKKLPPGTGLQAIRGSISTTPGTGKISAHPTVKVSMRIPGYCPSGVKVNRLDITCEKYKPFKGVKYMSKAGRYQIRT